MPKIFTDSQQNLNVYIYTNDHDPAHVHVFLGTKRERKPDIKIAIGSETERPRIIMKHPSIANKDAVAALKLVAKHQEQFLEEWYKYHD
ncbi:DUF4160 domain-containing protein [Laspinema olomoucense]|uniref:DUF4160 domain-containing protein n=1 Tax=Laspinema olomoucense D3b TaxID=2953688 RepID=A0ABT2N7E8_9CYAN|nr:DUF4160 domain-containing protein [Laspinema sp. D3b]MCT7978624.1 DUF4160 domain-containing protein [Laspinema sp. D3b]